MPRNGSGVYSPPAGTTATPGTKIESAKFNAYTADITADLNAPRPITAGGTGAASASGARTELGLAIGTNVQAFNENLADLAAIGTSVPNAAIIANPAGDGYAYRPRRRRLILAYSQSNFVNVDTFAWTPSPNLYVWNGGIDGDTGTAFAPCTSSGIRLPFAIASRLAEQDRDTDYYLVIVAKGATGLRNVIGTDYLWNTATTGDPGAGKIRFNATSTEVAYATTDADGRTRYFNLDLENTTSTGFPARIELVSNPAVNVVFNTTADFTSVPPYQTQPITVVSSASWPPANNSPVRVYPAQEWMRPVMTTNCEAAMTALGLTGANRVFDELWIWPTENERVYREAYRDKDFDTLLAFVSTWTDSATQILMTLPWPYHTDTAGAQIVRWYWYAIEQIVAKDTTRRKLVSLEGTNIADWGDTLNVHVVGGRAKLRIGNLIADSARRGGIVIPRFEQGKWNPTLTAVSNVVGLSTIGTRRNVYQRVGNIVTASLTLFVDPNLTGTLTEFRVSLPIPSELRGATDPANSGDIVALGVISSTRGDEAGVVEADFTANEALVSFTSSTTANHPMTIMLQYEVF